MEAFLLIADLIIKVLASLLYLFFTIRFFFFGLRSENGVAAILFLLMYKL